MAKCINLRRQRNGLTHKTFISLKWLPFILLLTSASTSASPQAPLEDWRSIVRQSPYWISQGVHANLSELRRWVLNSEAYCERNNRHILFDRRARFLAYVEDATSVEETQQRLNRRRAKLAEKGQVEHWVAGKPGLFGYPFALSCHQPHAQLEAALARYGGTHPDARLWGTWDGMQVGSEQSPVSLHKAILEVYRDRSERGRISLPQDTLNTLAGKILIESGARKKAHSAADARGVLQLSSAALNDCELDKEFHFHRMAQVDCAFRLLEQNHRNLEPVFQQRFGHLPEKKADRLYSLLLIQAYHGGVGRVKALLEGSQTAKAAQYFAQHHQRFSAGDIALGMVYHNLGRNHLGFSSLYYVIDVGIAAEVACEALDDLPGCDTPG